MAPVPPKDFSDLSRAYHGTHGAVFSVIGLVIDLMPPTVTSTGQHMLTFRLLDRQLLNSLHGSQGLTVRFFKSVAQDLPQIGGVGDIVLLRRIKMQPFNGQQLLLSSYATGVLVFPGAAIPEPNFSISFQGKNRLECRGVPGETQMLTPEEQAYVIELKNQMSAVTPGYLTSASCSTSAYVNRVDPPQTHTAMQHKLPPRPPLPSVAGLPPRPAPVGALDTLRSPTAPLAMRRPPPEPLAAPNNKRAKVEPHGSKVRLIEQLRHYEFADIYAEVVKKWTTNYGCDLYITDYTENKQLYHYAEEAGGTDGDSFNYTGQTKKWPGPYGYRVLKVNVKHPHSNFINAEVEVGEFVQLKNVKMKIMEKGTLEGDMWPDHWDPDKSNARKLPRDSSPAKTILERKAEYWAARKPAPEEAREPVAKLTKTERKKRRKQEAAERESRAKASKDAPAKSRTDANEFVRCNDLHVPITSLKEIMDPDDSFHMSATKNGTHFAMPFINVKHRAKVRCIDFAPRNLSTFAIPYTVPADEDASSESLLDLSYSTTTQKFEWNFSLLLEDASGGERAADALWVSVGHTEAQFLFGNDMPNPDDLTKDTSLLAKLQEKLCILWGNLAETKATDANVALSNRPFECCVAEFGVQTRDHDDQEHDTDPMQLDGVRGQGQRKWGWQRCFRMFGVTIL